MRCTKTFSIDSYPTQIKNLGEFLNQTFLDDVLFYFQRHELKSYDYKHTQNFISTPYLPKELSFIYSKDYTEFRFFCKAKKILSTPHNEEFFKRLKNKSNDPQFFLIPYFSSINSPVSPLGVYTENDKTPNYNQQEDFYSCSFEHEFNVKIYSNKIKVELKSKTKSPALKKIYLEFKSILRKTKVENKTGLRPLPSQNLQGQALSSASILSLPVEEIKKSIHNLKEHMNKGDCYLANMTYTQTLPSSQFLTHLPSETSGLTILWL